MPSIDLPRRRPLVAQGKEIAPGTPEQMASLMRRDAARWAAVIDTHEAVRSAPDPDARLMRFLQSTYRAAADLAQWNPALECAPGVPGVPRAVGSGPD